MRVAGCPSAPSRIYNTQLPLPELPHVVCRRATSAPIPPAQPSPHESRPQTTRSGCEYALETYYRMHWNPGYNRDRGTATIIGFRINACY